MANRGSKNKSRLVALFVIVLVSFSLITINLKSEKGSGFLEPVFVWLVSPVQNLIVQTTDSIVGSVQAYLLLVDTAEENKRLKEILQNLKNQNNDLQEKLRLRDRVDRLLDYGQRRKENYLLASVVGRDATQWSKTIFIDKGLNQGVRENLAVVLKEGVVGHVIQASGNASKVLLITDSRSSVDALIRDTRSPGVVVGTGNGHCKMIYVPITAEVKEGDKVLSSGMGGVFPKGLLLGTVTRVKKKKQGLFQEIDVAPEADLSRLEEVLILTS